MKKNIWALWVQPGGDILVSISHVTLTTIYLVLMTRTKVAINFLNQRMKYTKGYRRKHYVTTFSQRLEKLCIPAPVFVTRAKSVHTQAQ